MLKLNSKIKYITRNSMVNRTYTTARERAKDRGNHIKYLNVLYDIRVLYIVDLSNLNVNIRHNVLLSILV
jgi:hypothetical protein